MLFSQINKIAGFKLVTLLAPELNYKDFDDLLSMAINGSNSQIEMKQFKQARRINLQVDRELKL